MVFRSLLSLLYVYLLIQLAYASPNPGHLPLSCRSLSDSYGFLRIKPSLALCQSGVSDSLSCNCVNISRSLSNCCRVRCKRYLCQMRIRTLTPTPNANSASPVINVFIGALLSPRSRRERGPLLLLDNPSYADHVFQTNQDVNCTRDTATLDAG